MGSGRRRDRIVEFFERTTTDGSDFVQVDDRIATIDNDGTLWAEHPAYTQLMFALDQFREEAGEHPEWQDAQPFKAAIEGDLETLATFGVHAIAASTRPTSADGCW